MANRSVPAIALITGGAVDAGADLAAVARQLRAPHAIAIVRHMVTSCLFTRGGRPKRVREERKGRKDRKDCRASRY